MYFHCYSQKKFQILIWVTLYVRIYNKVHWLLRVIARLKSMQSLNCTIVLRYAYSIIKNLILLALSNTYFIDFTLFCNFSFLFIYPLNKNDFDLYVSRHLFSDHLSRGMEVSLVVKVVIDTFSDVINSRSDLHGITHQRPPKRVKSVLTWQAPLRWFIPILE